MSYLISDADMSWMISQLDTAQVLTPAQDRGLVIGVLKRLREISGTVPTTSPITTLPVVTPPVVTPAPAPSPAPTVLTQDKVAAFRGIDYSGLEDFTVGLTPVKDSSGKVIGYTLDRPSEAELSDFRKRGVTYLRIALMRGYTENAAAERAMAQRVSKVFGRAFSTHRHTYAKSGKPVNGEPQGAPLTRQEVVDQAVKDVATFGDIPGWFFLGMNEPAVSGREAEWIQTCVAEYDAIRATGYKGLIVSSIPGNSMGGASSKMGGIPQRMLDDASWTYGGSMYPSALGDYGYRSSIAELDAAAAKRWDKPASFAQGMTSWVKEGPQGQRIAKSGPLKDKVPLITETAYSQPVHTQAFADLAKRFGFGWCLWSTGANKDWAFNGSYRQSIRDADLTALLSA